MLELNEITKSYSMGAADAVQALKGINIKFRRCDLVSILGPSGCGKSTTLNIIGGLDQYTSGDLVINGRSTKGFKDRDWDNYRNHSVGFIFQSYNLIRHQSVLDNVELALTLSGVSKKNRREKAKKALIDVGLGAQINKTPKEMSGGQMQRVAIARALVNDPDIILADEPTGALDSKTSVQVMEILKQVAKDRLVVMVTHNPELAEQYSTRIIRMKDGEVVEDTRPLSPKEIEQERERDLQELKAESIVAAEEAGKEIDHTVPRFKIFKNLNNTKLKTPKELIERAREKRKQPHLSHKDQFKLSIKNLFTKKGRTILTAFAGSVGIFGIGAVLAISQGMNGYITETEEKTLATAPLTISSNATDFTVILQSVTDLLGNSTSGPIVPEDPDSPEVRRKEIIGNIAILIQDVLKGDNNLEGFKKYLDQEVADPNSSLGKAIAGINYEYGMELSCFYPEYENPDDPKEDEIVEVHECNFADQIVNLMTNYMDFSADIFKGFDVTSLASIVSSLSSLTGGSSAISLSVWEELLTDKNDPTKLNPMIEKQYELVGTASEWPDEPNEIVVVCDANYSIPDITLYSLGLIPEEEMGCLMNDAITGSHTWEEQWKDKSKKNWSLEALRNQKFKIIPNYNYYIKGAESWIDIRKSPDLLVNVFKDETKSMDLKISGIVKLKDEYATSGGLIGGSLAYTRALRDQVISEATKSDIYKEQEASKTIDILTGLPFKSSATGRTMTTEEKAKYFVEYVSSSLYDKLSIEELEAAGLSKIEIAKVVSGRASVQRRFLLSFVLNAISEATSIDEFDDVFGKLKNVAEEIAESLPEGSVYADLITEILDFLQEKWPGKDGALDKIIAFALTFSGMSQEEAELYVNNLKPEQKISLAKEAASTIAEEIIVKHDLVSDEKRELDYRDANEDGTIGLLSFYNSYFAVIHSETVKDALLAVMYDDLIEFSSNTYEDNMTSFGGVNTDLPTNIKIYANTFGDKSKITAGVDEYNRQHPDDADQIKYTDYVGFIMSSVGKILDIITYVLIAFAAISLVVSSIMIAVITLISVQERTKEIGILRAIGASKNNVSGMFRAETIIIGLMSGVLGVIFSYILCLPLNPILRNITGAATFTAMLAPWKALILIAISMVLTVLSGLIPSSTAAKKDPVEALRSE